MGQPCISGQIAENAEYLYRSPLHFAFSNMNSSETDVKKAVKGLARYFRAVHFQPGEVIIREGDPANKFYVIVEGKVVISIKSGKVRLCEKNPPDFFGEAGILSNTPRKRTATVNALDYTICLEINNEQFAKYLSSTSSGCKEKLQMIIGGNMEKTLASIPFMRNLSKEELRMLSGIVQYRVMGKREILFHTGELGTEVFIVCSGKVSAIGKRKNIVLSPTEVNRKAVRQEAKISEQTTSEGIMQVGRSQFIKMEDPPDEKGNYVVSFRPGDFFGELGMVMGIPRTATVVAEDTTLLLALRKCEFHKFLSTVDIDFDTLMRSRSLDHLRNCHRHTFLDVLPEEKRFDVFAQYFSINVWQPGKQIFRRNDQSDTLYLVAYGEVSITESGERESGRKGAILGAVDVLADRGNNVYQSSVQAVDRTITLSITRGGIEKCFENCNRTTLVDWDLKLLRESCKIHHVLHHPVGMKYFMKEVMAQCNSELLEFWCQIRAFHEFFEPEELKKYPPYSERACPKKKDDNRVPPKVSEIKRGSSQILEDKKGIEEKAGNVERVQNSDRPENMSQKHQELMMKVANFISKKYLEDMSVLGMNVTRSPRARIKKDIEMGRYRYDMFTPAQFCIERVLSINSFMRLKRQPSFLEMLKDVDVFKPYSKKEWKTYSIGLSLTMADKESESERVDKMLSHDTLDEKAI
mmetsp:Transcript_2913/g.4274  ORF Transcript_2913/g.4274 Transcript_2913/m.4274 type:complete len:693 (+) Transcript_2913:92-2170(+)